MNQIPLGKSGTFRDLPSGIWAIGLVSMFMDISSELIHSLLPVFMSTTLGASMMTIGLIEGVAEASSAITKVFSGVISDYIGKRKLLAVIGYGLAAVTKPVFPLANTIGWVFTARFIDRIGKGIRGAPRDALVADITPHELRGAAYGLRQSLDTVGAFIGPLIALVFMIWISDNIRTVLWIAGIPAMIAVAILVFGVHDPERAANTPRVQNPLKIKNAGRLPGRFWFIVLLGAIFSMARFSEAFLILRAQDTGLAIGLVPLVLIVMNVFYTGTAYPAGVASDRFSQKAILIMGLAMLISADLILAAAVSPLSVFFGSALWGIHMGLTQGLFSKLVADTAPEEFRGTAFGIYNLINGVALLLSGFIAGLLWNVFGAPATFLSGVFFAMIAAIGLLIYKKKTLAVKK